MSGKLVVFVAASTIIQMASATLSRADNARFDECRAKLVKAQKLEVLYAFDWKPPKAPYVVAGATFMSMPIDAKEGFAETVNCFLMAGDSGCINFDVLHWQTGKAIGRFKNCRFSMN